MNNKGKGSSLILIIILIVALIIAFLVVNQMGSLGVGNTTQIETQQNPVDQAQNAVDAINERMMKAGQKP